MLLTFKCRHFHDIVMFGDIGIALLKAMGESGRVPGAITGERVTTARQQLQAAMTGPLGNAETVADNDSTGNREERDSAGISLRQRAQPLLQMLEAAAENESEITWS